MAEHGRGEVEYVALKRRRLERRAGVFTSACAIRLLTDISVDWGGLPVRGRLPESDSRSLQRKAGDLVGALHAAAGAAYTLEGQDVGPRFRARDSGRACRRRKRGTTCSRRSGRAREVDDLMGQDMQRHAARASRATSCAKRSHSSGWNIRLMTQFTSFVAVEDGLTANTTASAADANTPAANVSLGQFSNFPTQRTVTSLYAASYGSAGGALNPGAAMTANVTVTSNAETMDASGHRHTHGRDGSHQRFAHQREEPPGFNLPRPRHGPGRGGPVSRHLAGQTLLSTGSGPIPTTSSLTASAPTSASTRTSKTRGERIRHDGRPHRHGRDQRPRVNRRDPGSDDSHSRRRAAVRAHTRRPNRDHHSRRHEPIPRLSLRALRQRRARRGRLVRQQPRVGEAASPHEQFRRHVRRPRQERPDIFLRLLRRLAAAPARSCRHGRAFNGGASFLRPRGSAVPERVPCADRDRKT